MRTLEDIIKEANKVHNNKYDYSKAVYTKLIEPIEIICPIHGSFFQSPHSHLKGSGCPECAKIARINKKKDDLNTFIEKAIKTHGNKYDYSKVKYIDSKTKVCIICPEHGEFWQAPYLHILGNGCPGCKSDTISKLYKYSKEEFIKKANSVHNGKYDYSKVEYVDSRTKVCIVCPKHGEFWQTPTAHLSGKGCKMCSNENKHNIKTTDKFIEDSINVHSYKYDYSNTVYTGSLNPVTITCKKHGDFLQKPHDHLNGCGCPKCSMLKSNYETEISNFIKSFVDCDVIESDRTILSGNELDIYIPSKNIAFEFDGLYWHSEVNKTPSYHLEKTNVCESNGIQLIHIFEDEWIYKKDICKSRIMNLLNSSNNRVFARKCTIKEVNTSTERDFLVKNHIQGYTSSKLCYGLFYNEELISLMSFSSLRKNLGSKSIENNYELLRFCNKIGYSVIGAASKLFNHFLKTINPDRVISYADRRWSIGNLYNKLGFTEIRRSKPSYFYVIGDKRKNRFNFRKDVLISKYGCTKEETEHSFCLKNKWYRIYDCGTIVFEWKKGEI